MRLKCLLAVDLDLPEFFFPSQESCIANLRLLRFADTKSLLADHLDWFDLVLSSHNSNNQSYTCSGGVAGFSKWVLFFCDLGTFTKVYFTSSHMAKQSHKGSHDEITWGGICHDQQHNQYPLKRKTKTVLQWRLIECVIELKFHVTELKTFEPHNLIAVRNKMPPQSVVAHHRGSLKGKV
jgi:hypothetical protein